ncbi:DUF2567 domain-containing protein [Amycolatopsis sp. cg5]|uniref:DUF2567 domain-containing protein n=1 Tax=Amycolatopsis sp. cg5 TaxID=3238802 RepID=UPI0035246EA1
MAESSVGAHRSSRLDDPWSVPPVYRIPLERPKVRVKADILPAISLAGTSTLLAFPLVYLWSLLAPTQRFRVYEGGLAPLDLESWHRFDSLAIFGFLSIGAGVLIAAVAWLMRERRGPVMLVAAALGALGASAVGVLSKGMFLGKYDIAKPPSVGDVIVAAPTLDTWWVIIAAPTAAVVVYGICAAWNGLDDLGRRLG